MGRAGGQRHLFNKVFQTRGREQAAQRGGAHRRPVGHAVVFQFADRFAVANRIKRDFGGRAEHVLIKRVEIERPAQNMLADNVRINLPVALDNRIGQAQRH
jgi:hypothetical protein